VLALVLLAAIRQLPVIRFVRPGPLIGRGRLQRPALCPFASCGLRLYSAACSAPGAFPRGHAIMLFSTRRNRPKLVEGNPEMLGKLCQRSGQYPTGVVDGMATDDTKGDRDHLLWFR
jgi:hypothetical protein